MHCCHLQKIKLSKMADAAARREARRRKILENSHNRLQIISGKSSEEFLKENPSKTVSPEPEYAVPTTESISSQLSASQLNGVIFSPPAELLEFLSGSHGIDASGDAEENDLAPLLPPTGLVPPTDPIEVPTLTIWEKITAHKYDIVLLSLFLQILYSFSLPAYFDNGYFFLPVIVYIVTKMIWFPTQSNSSFANMLMLLNGVSPARIQKVLYVTQCFGTMTHDIFIFLFTTICIQSLYVMLRDNL